MIPEISLQVAPGRADGRKTQCALGRTQTDETCSLTEGKAGHPTAGRDRDFLPGSFVCTWSDLPGGRQPVRRIRGWARGYFEVVLTESGRLMCVPRVTIRSAAR
jgi:hypothetical protein